MHSPYTTPRAISAQGLRGRPGQGCYARTVVARTPTCHGLSLRRTGVRPHVLAFHRSAMVEGWDDDKINAGIAHLQSLHAVPKRSATNVDTAPSALVSCQAMTCPNVVGKPARLAVCTFGRDPPGFSRHLRKHRNKNCTKCQYARNRPSWKQATQMSTLAWPRSWRQAKPVSS